MVKQNRKSARAGTKVSLKGGGDTPCVSFGVWAEMGFMCGTGPGVGSPSPLTILLHFCYPE